MSEKEKGGDNIKKMLKKTLSLFAVIMIIFGCNISAFSYNDSVYSLDDAKMVSNLTISGNTANCKSTFSDTTNNIKTVKIVQTLEKHWAFGLFFAVSGGSFEKTVSTGQTDFTSKVFSLDSGTYRLKSDFTVTLISGESDTFTVYSSEKTV